MDAWHYSDISDALDNQVVELIDVVIAWDDRHVSMRYLRHRSTRYDDRMSNAA